MNMIKLRSLLQQFLIEDMGERDITGESIFAEETGEGLIIAKESGIIAGTAVIGETYRMLDEDMITTIFVKDGDRIEKGQQLARVEGKVSALLAGERLILNLLQRMSGIATVTAKAVDALADSSIHVCDTRKTTPGLRMLEKYAVRCGGGFNHRLGLYDGVMIKDNHIAAAGSITLAVQKVREVAGHMVKVEVETETAEEVMEAVAAGADVIMFDNRSPEEVRAFAALVPNQITTEISGGITLDTIGDYRGTGAGCISLGFITHSAKALDISFNLTGGKKQHGTPRPVTIAGFTS